MNSDPSQTPDSSDNGRASERHLGGAPSTVRSSENNQVPSETTQLGELIEGGAEPRIVTDEACVATEASSIPERIGRYRLIRELGRGGFGTVYLAHDDAADRLVAIKLPRADRVTCDRAKQGFLREARHAAKLKHRNIVTLYEVGEADGQCYLVYEYIE